MGQSSLNMLNNFYFSSSTLYDPRKKSSQGLELVVDNTMTTLSMEPTLSRDSLETLGIKKVGHTFLYVKERAEYEANGQEIIRKGQSRFTSNKDVADLVTEYETLFKTGSDALEHRAKQFDFAVEYLSKDKILTAQEVLYQSALKLIENGEFNSTFSVMERLTKKQQDLLTQVSLLYMKKGIEKDQEGLKLYQKALAAIQMGDYVTALSFKGQMMPEQEKILGEAIVEHFLRTTEITPLNKSVIASLKQWYDWKEFESAPDFFQEGNERVYQIGMDPRNKARSSTVMLDTACWAAKKDLSVMQIAEALVGYQVLSKAEERIQEQLGVRTREAVLQARTMALEYNLTLMQERAQEQLSAHAQFEQERVAIDSYQEAARFNIKWLQDGRVAFDPAAICKPFSFINVLKTGFRRLAMA